ncbi:MAG: regulatory protein RecX [Gemmatimonadetes bacterium]|nr:regulatory protein RecX [Gemmatimonadota bacterium]
MKLESAKSTLFETDGAVEKAKAYVLRLLGRRAYTKKEICDKLAGRGYGQDAIEQTLSMLKRLDLIDDVLFARQFVEQRLRLRPSGRVALVRDLVHRGVPAEIIDRVLDDVLADVDIEAVALDLMMSRANRYRGLSREKALGRMYGFLGRRGFEASVARDVAHKVWSKIENEEG